MTILKEHPWSNKCNNYFRPSYFSLIFWFVVVVAFTTAFSPVISSSYYCSFTNTVESRLMFASRNPDNALTNAAPLYITVGPPCCGKSTILQRYPPHGHQQQIVDISLDDQPDVYVPVDTTSFLKPDDSTTSDKQTLHKVYHGKTLAERIRHDNIELNLILRRWNGTLSPQNFAIGIFQYYQQQGHSTSVAQMLIRAVEESVRQTQSKSSAASLLPPNVQVFCVESLFRPHPNTNQSAIQRALKLLRTTPPHIPVAWGNTNSKSKDYQMALEIACQTRRPVQFLISAPTNEYIMTSSSIPWVPLPTLLLRNLHRLSQMGKYVPAMAIADCYRRIDQLFANMTTTTTSTSPEVSNNGDFHRNATTSTPAVFAMEQYLVQLAEPRGHRNGKSTYQYRLTKNRLIQKDFTASQQQLDSPFPNTNNFPGKNGNETRQNWCPSKRSWPPSPSTSGGSSPSRQKRRRIDTNVHHPTPTSYLENKHHL